MIKSINRLDVPDGKYYGVYSSDNIRLYEITIKEFIYINADKQDVIIEFKVDKGIRSMGTKVSVDIIDGWAYINISLQETRELKLNIITK
jgi:hypothetical protein